MMLNGSILAYALLLSSAVAAIAAVPASSPAERPPLLQGVCRLVTMGASITQYASRPGGYVWRIQHALNALYPNDPIEVIDVGISGNTSGDMVGRFKHDVVDQHPDLVTIKEGFNDLTRRLHGGTNGANAEEYGKNMETMVRMSQAANFRVLIMTPTIYENEPDSSGNEQLKDYVKAIRDLAAREHLPLADQNAALLEAWAEQRNGNHERLTTDGVHLTLLGDAVLARTTLLALGIPAAQLDAIEPGIKEEIDKAVKDEGHK
ncbi:MAG: GDSL-type esterase/lipase family protein [Armatimonadota bacterium]|nr:GDSL-type esterase/lipase family protein [Armatimonadota bacterium]